MGTCVFSDQYWTPGGLSKLPTRKINETKKEKKKREKEREGNKVVVLREIAQDRRTRFISVT